MCLLWMLLTKPVRRGALLAFDMKYVRIFNTNIKKKIGNSNITFNTESYTTVSRLLGKKGRIINN